ncbi:sensor domain-containing protein [Amycolatopsis taiwanensis]|uniref:sensor domain-containing protein n=1 Tax=Amycolatopsis taiwanensis TaxID=342230 RepID=UPI00146FB003|nr:sensor domain-containing protein [Amycolatopsis taiwanensis]
MSVRDSDASTRVRPGFSVLVVASLALTSACTSPVGGHPAVGGVVQGTVAATFLTLDEVSALVGAPLASADSVSEPPAALTSDPPTCAAAVGPATEAVYARGWQRFGATSYQDSTAEHVVTQVLGVYPDQDTTQAAFRTLTDGLSQCPEAVRTNQDHSSAKWTYAVEGTAADSVAWTATEDAGDGWACFREARQKETALLEVSVCQAGNGKQAAQTIMERFAAKVNP